VTKEPRKEYGFEKQIKNVNLYKLKKGRNRRLAQDKGMTKCFCFCFSTQSRPSLLQYRALDCEERNEKKKTKDERRVTTGETRLFDSIFSIFLASLSTEK
jgi:hypothetical protein